MINAKIQELINLYETNCPFKLARQLGITVLYEDLGDTLGYYSKYFRMKFIHVNQNISEKKQQYTCSHELGHAILHPNDNTAFLKKNTFFSSDVKEIEANTFAVNLLFHEQFFDNETICFQEVIEEYGVPKQLAILKSKLF
ncbi:hypothetical protein J27TS8_04800 [Robertmurraya siralis]|uniref:IrrE N-terminal-like domain-containing protein n=1 Tax=Robertmurraya siralis TaxID=77777 RepID=A0A920BSR6_9BACI|nr:ImmA/IrrE family metallo-endopeptidase [Robertmurraya siralis]PAE22000.1 ImmA/IrrE family metallo-endopeptidase [Bacillus sp. 7504-2]GIN60487.1 hypothetical protein J27TS8_04800 [Robertmurraya siralis]